METMFDRTELLALQVASAKLSETIASSADDATVWKALVAAVASISPLVVQRNNFIAAEERRRLNTDKGW